MARAGALLLLAVALLPGAARAGACSPLTCSPSQFTLARGTLLALRLEADKPIRVIDLRTGATRWWLPPGVVSGHTLVHQDGQLLTWFDLTTGQRLRDALLQEHGAYQLVGLSQDASTAVLARTQHRSTTFAIVSPQHQRIVKLGGNNWSFDALSGKKLFLVQQLKNRYEIRWLDGASGPLGALASKDLLWGSPWSRVSSADGRYLFTLYLAPNGSAMVHVLDTRAGTAQCVDLPGTGNWDAASTYAMVVDPDGRHLWAISPGYGRIVSIDVASRTIARSFRFHAGSWSSSYTVAVLAPDGERFALSDGYHLWYLVPGKQAVAGPTHTSIALGYSPDQKRLWVLGQRSRLTALPVR